jgi:hypothetical protein
VKFQYFSGPQRGPVPPYGIHVLTLADATGAITVTLEEGSASAAAATARG